MPLASTIAPTSLSAESSLPSLGLRVWHGAATTCLVATVLFWILTLGIAGILHGWVVPNLDSLKPHIESWLSQKIEAKLTIGNITTSPEGLLPRFDIRDVRVSAAKAEKTGNMPSGSIHFGRVQVSVSPMRLLQGKLDQLLIENPELDVSRDAIGRLNVAGFVIESKAGSGAGLDWLMSQRAIAIEGGTLHWQDDALQQPKVTLTHLSFALQNNLISHQAMLSARPPPHWGEQIQIATKFTQPLFERRAGRWQSWSGQVYTKLHAPRPEPVLRATVAHPPPAWLSTAKLLSGTQKIEVWANFANAVLGPVTAIAQQIPRLAHRLQATYNPADHLLRLEGTQIQTATALAGVAPLWKDDQLSQDPWTAMADNGLIEQLKLEVRDLSAITIDARFSNSDLAGDIQGTWDSSAHAAGLVDMTARLSRLDLSTLHRYLPAKTPIATRQNLQKTLLAGAATDLKLSLKGAPATLSLDALRISGELKDVQVALAPNWPQLTQGKALFELADSSLAITQIDTMLGNLPLTGRIRVADVLTPVVEVSAESLQTPLASALELLHQTPAGSAAFSQAEATGLVDLKAQLLLPLSNLRSSQYSGQLQLQSNTLLLNRQAPWLTQMKGQLGFSEAGLALQNVRAQLLGGQVSLSGSLGQIKGQGDVSVAALRSWQPGFDAVLNKASGQVAYTIAMTQGVGAGAETDTRLQIESSLIGLALDLPAPLSKAAATPWPANFQYNTQGVLALKVDDVLDAQLQQRDAHWHGQIAVGQASPPLPTAAFVLDPAQSGISLSIQLPKLDISAWQAVLANGSSATQTATNYAFPKSVSAQIQDLVWKDRHFEQVVLGASRANASAAADSSTWRINAQANDFNGYAEYRTGSPQVQPHLYARLARLSIPDATSKSRIEQLLEAPQTSLPGLDIVIDDFELIGKKLGRIEVIATNQRALGQLSTLGSSAAQSEWRVHKLALINPDASLNATGVWSQPRQNERSRVDLQFNWAIQNSGDLLTRLGLPGTIQNGKGQLQGRVGWIGSPLGLDYPSLSGLIKLDMTQGQFLKIDPGMGRLLSVLSLQALPRRLTFDFRDVFSEGFAFDTITGDAQIKEGVLGTQNLQMHSVLALVSLQGSVNLAKETQNLRVLVLPDLNAGGASLLAAIVNPVVGAFTYLAQLILRRPVVAAATKAYKIEGSWQAPVVTPIAP